MRNNNNQRGKPQKSITSPIEAVKDLGSGIVNSATKDLVGGVASDAIRQLFGPAPEKAKIKEELSQEEVERKPLYITRERPLYVEEDKKEIAYKANLVLSEIKQIAKKTEGLEKQLGDFSLEEPQEEPGTYHLSFFGRILKLLRKARKAIHDAATWLSVWQARSQKRGLLAGYGYGVGRKSTTAAIQRMLGSEMGVARSGA